MTAERLRWGVRCLMFAGIVAYFWAQGRGFTTTLNLFSIMEGFALLGLVALGLGLTMIAGEFDLSIGAVVATAGIVTLQVGEHQLAVGLLAGVGFGLAVGLVNGALVTLLGLHSMVVTVGMLIAVAGIGSQLTGGEAVSSSDYELSTSITAPILEVLSPRSLVTIGVLLLAGLVLWKSRLGRDVVAVGSDRRAATAAGVRARPALVAVFAFSGAAGGLAGSLLAYSLASAAPDFSGGGSLLLQGVTAAIVGGVALSGGYGSIRGIAFGTLVLAVFGNGLGSVGASGAAIALANGALLLSIVVLDSQAAAIVRRIHRRLHAPPDPGVAGLGWR